ncbi:MAG: ribosome biogenesis GTP-binding protein YihA/YsxC [Chitinophagaceae bacterium]|nr:ribosome biogenesis GTP-binding protein YihA/YsxC [Chitinophagaceae bacterium]
MDILKAEYIISKPDVAQCPAPDRPEFAFIGRSNVGKSSLINMLTGQKNLAKTSAEPGKTQLINHFGIKSRKNGNSKHTTDWYLVDLPGYGYAKVSQKSRRSRRRWEQMIENYIRKRENLVNLFVLIDSRHTPQKIDIEFINQLGEWGIPFTMVFTKADKEKPGAVKRNVEQFRIELSKTWDELPMHFLTSSHTREGREELLGFLETIIENV